MELNEGNSTNSPFIRILGTKSELRVNQRETCNVDTERELRQGCCISHILFNLHRIYLMKEALPEFGDFKIEGRIVNKVRFADDMTFISKILEELLGMLIRELKWIEHLNTFEECVHNRYLLHKGN